MTDTLFGLTLSGACVGVLIGYGLHQWHLARDRRRVAASIAEAERALLRLWIMAHRIDPESPDFARHANEALAAAAEWKPTDEEIARVTGGAA